MGGIGMGGLTGRPPVRPRPEPLEFEDEERAPGKAIPSTCQRVLNSRIFECPGMECAGIQRDGSCLCDVVKACNDQGVDWLFELDKDGFWALVVE